MALNLIYITKEPKVALIAEKYGVDRIMVDLETLGKEERQKGLNTVKSNHTLEDVLNVANVLSTSELLVRVNPWNENSVDEIESVITAGADRIMLPMWKSKQEVDQFLSLVDRRVKTILLLETKEAVECLDFILENPLIDEIYIGLNDLHLSYKLTFMFELLANGMVEYLAQIIKKRGIPFGFGGIARIGEGILPATSIVMEHYRLGSSIVILSRSFCNTDKIKDTKEIDKIFSENLQLLRSFENTLPSKTNEDYINNIQVIKNNVSVIVRRIKE